MKPDAVMSFLYCMYGKSETTQYSTTMLPTQAARPMRRWASARRQVNSTRAHTAIDASCAYTDTRTSSPCACAELHTSAKTNMHRQRVGLNMPPLISWPPNLSPQWLASGWLGRLVGFAQPGSFAARTSTFSIDGGLANNSPAFSISAAATAPER